MNRWIQAGRALLVVVCGVLLAACEKGPADSGAEPFPAVGPGEFAFEVEGAVSGQVTGEATFYHPFDGPSRTVLLTGHGGYPELSFNGGMFGPAFAFPEGRHTLDPTRLLIIASLVLSSEDADRYMVRGGYVNIRESTAERVVGEFELTGAGPAPGSVRVRGAFHALAEEF